LDDERIKQMPYYDFKYFKYSDFDCQGTGENEMSVEFIHRLDELREACGFPFYITSGFRSPNHSIEKRKQNPGTHAQGIAADIAVSGGAQRRAVVEKALEMGFKGVGVAKGFVHVDIRETTPVLWCY
jgi:zinc D-Ala-D-Ala carboxypeptidase